MKRLYTPNAPAAVGPYAQAVVRGNFLTGKTLYASGQIALTPEGVLVNNNVEEETHQVMKNISAILGAAGCRFSDVIQTRIYLRDDELFKPVNSVYGDYFQKGQEPVRECVVAAPPLEGANVEMSVLAAVPRFAIFHRS